MSDQKIPAVVVSGRSADMGESLSAIRQFVSSASQQAGLDKQAVYKLTLAVDEIAANIFIYGYRDTVPDAKIGIAGQISDGLLTVRLEDSAPAFDPVEHLKTAEFDLDVPIDERIPGGLGIKLAIDNVDAFRYEYLDGRNCNIFMMKRPGKL
jgi:anti-sigma regulatory factor (Ser/Thr protein kinase)